MVKVAALFAALVTAFVGARVLISARRAAGVPTYWRHRLNQPLRPGDLRLVAMATPSCRGSAQIRQCRDMCTRDDDLEEVIGGSKQYISDFDAAERQSGSAQELVDRMMALHGDRGNPFTLWNAATEAFRAHVR